MGSVLTTLATLPSIRPVNTLPPIPHANAPVSVANAAQNITQNPEIPVPTGQEESGAADQSDAARTQNLLKRDRGLFGTVRTSTRGLLETNEGNVPARKTLLGE